MGLHDHHMNGILADEMVGWTSCLAALARSCMMLHACENTLMLTCSMSDTHVAHMDTRSC